MPQRVARGLLVVVLVSAGASAPLAHVHPAGHDHAALSPEGHSHAAHHQEQGAHWHLTGRQVPDGPGIPARVGNRHHHAAVAVATVAVERPSVRGGGTPALLEVWEGGTAPDGQGRSVPVAANARPNPPPRILLVARAPPG